MLHLLNEANDYKFVSRKWKSVNGNSKSNYGVGTEIIYNTEVLKSTKIDEATIQTDSQNFKNEFCFRLKVTPQIIYYWKALYFWVRIPEW